MRSRSASNRSLFGIIRKGTGQVYGVARIKEVLEPFTSVEEYETHQEFHQIEPDQVKKAFDKGWTVPWVLENVKLLAEPVPYTSLGGVTWVTIDDQAVHAIEAQLQ